MQNLQISQFFYYVLFSKVLFCKSVVLKKKMFLFCFGKVLFFLLTFVLVGFAEVVFCFSKFLLFCNLKKIFFFILQHFFSFSFVLKKKP